MPLNYPVIDSLIAQFEGFGKAGVPATVNNNPGNLIASPFSTAQGAIGSNNGFAVFPDPQTGTAAMDALVQHYDSKGLTIADLIQKWSPGSAPGNTPAGTQSYTDFLSAGLGVPSQTQIGMAEKKTPDSGSPTGSGSSTPSLLSSINSAVFQAINGRKPGQSGSDATGTQAQFTFARIGAFILGFIFIAAGLYMFKPVQNIVTTTARGAIAA